MPVVQYFGWAGSFLLATLLAANWCLPAPMAPHAAAPLDQKIRIRIHTDHKWPERVVFDTAGAMVVAQEAGVATGIGGSKPAVATEREPFDALAEMAGIPVRPCFRPPCSAGRAAEQSPLPGKAVPSRFRARLAEGKNPTFPSRLRKPPGRS
jgi:hypothetical protein